MWSYNAWRQLLDQHSQCHGQASCYKTFQLYVWERSTKKYWGAFFTNHHFRVVWYLECMTTSRYKHPAWQCAVVLYSAITSTCHKEKNHLAAFCAWDSSPHLPITPLQLMRLAVLAEIHSAQWVTLCCLIPRPHDLVRAPPQPRVLKCPNPQSLLYPPQLLCYYLN